MPATSLRKEEGIGLILAIAAHLGLAAFLLWRPAGKALVTPPERMTVTLSDELAPTSTSPEPNAQAAPDRAPTIGEPAPPEPEPVAEPEPEPLPPPPVPKPPAPKAVAQPKPEPKPAPRPAPRAVERPTPAPAPKPSPQATPRPPQPAPKAAAQPRNQPAPKAPARPPQQQQQTNRPAGASSFADAFKNGVPGAQNTGQSRTPPAAAAGPLRASFGQSVLREVRPNWQGRVPQGVNTEKLVTILSIELNRDGSLAKPPRVVRQEGIDDENRPQAQRHAEEAIRAVQLSAPFDLPADQYDLWKNLPPLRFRKNL